MGSYFSWGYLEDEQWDKKQIRLKYLLNEDIKNNWILRKKEYKPFLFEKIIKKKRKKKRKYIL